MATRGNFSLAEKSKIAERLTAARNRRNLTNAKIADGCGVTRATAGNWADGTYVPGPEHGRNLEKVLGITYSELVFGSTAPVHDGATKLPPGSWIENTTPASDGQVAIPFFKDLSAAVESGTMQSAGKVYLSRATLRSEVADPDFVYAAPVPGNSMLPWIPDGTTVGVDPQETTVVDGNLYAIEHGGLHRVKALIETPDAYRVISYNAAEHPEVETPKNEIAIVGAIFWISQMRRSFPAV